MQILTADKGRICAVDCETERVYTTTTDKFSVSDAYWSSAAFGRMGAMLPYNSRDDGPDPAPDPWEDGKPTPYFFISKATNASKRARKQRNKAAAASRRKGRR